MRLSDRTSPAYSCVSKRRQRLVGATRFVHDEDAPPHPACMNGSTPTPQSDSKSSAITVLISVRTHTYIIVVTSPHHQYAHVSKKNSERLGRRDHAIRSQGPDFGDPTPSSHKTQLRPVPRNAECCARDMPRPLDSMRECAALTNALAGPMGRRNGHLNGPVCVCIYVLFAIAH
jgi:hypothetical protein